MFFVSFHIPGRVILHTSGMSSVCPACSFSPVSTLLPSPIWVGRGICPLADPCWLAPQKASSSEGATQDDCARFLHSGPSGGRSCVASLGESWSALRSESCVSRVRGISGESWVTKVTGCFVGPPTSPVTQRLFRASLAILRVGLPSSRVDGRRGRGDVSTALLFPLSFVVGLLGAFVSSSWGVFGFTGVVGPELTSRKGFGASVIADGYAGGPMSSGGMFSSPAGRGARRGVAGGLVGLVWLARPTVCRVGVGEARPAVTSA